MRQKVCVLLLLLLAISACETKPRETDLLIMGLESPPRSFDPRYALDAYSDRVNKLLYRGLFRIGHSAEPEPDLATAWHYTPATQPPAMYLDVTLTTNARFHNGSALTAVDVAWTFMSILRDKSPRAAGLQSVRSVTAVSSTQVRFALKHAFAPLLSALTLGIVPVGSGRDLGQAPTGAGSFKLVENSPEGIVLERVTPTTNRINRLKLKVIRNDSARSLALEKGEIDLLQNALPPQDLSRFAENDHFVVERFPGSNISYLGFNLRDPILSHPAVRQAISLGIDRSAILKSLMYSTGHPTGTVLPRNNWAYDARVKADNYDPGRAVELLEKAGYSRPKAGEPRFALVYKTSTNRLRVRIAEAIGNYLAQIGIKVKVESLDFGTFFDQIRNGSFQMYTLTWTGLTEPDILYYAFSSEATPPSGANRGFLTDAKIDQLTGEARTTLNRRRRQELYRAAQERLASLRPYAVLWDNDAIVVRRREVQRFEPYPDGSLYFVDAMAALQPSPTAR